MTAEFDQIIAEVRAAVSDVKEDHFFDWDYVNACSPDNIAAILNALSEATSRADAAEDEVAEINGIWPAWAEATLKSVRAVSGYDGYDDRWDGVDLPAEIDELIEELTDRATKAEAERDAAVEALKAIADLPLPAVHPEKSNAANRAARVKAGDYLRRARSITAKEPT